MCQTVRFLLPQLAAADRRAKKSGALRVPTMTSDLVTAGDHDDKILPSSTCRGWSYW